MTGHPHPLSPRGGGGHSLRSWRPLAAGAQTPGRRLASPQRADGLEEGDGETVHYF